MQYNENSLTPIPLITLDVSFIFTVRVVKGKMLNLWGNDIICFKHFWFIIVIVLLYM